MPVLPVLEVCCDSAEAAAAALQGLGCGAYSGSGRIELCAALSDGGLTPSLGLQEAVVRMAAAAERPVPVMVLVRPRGGDFCYTSLEHEIMVSRA
jgi:copper homeostasis protein